MDHGPHTLLDDESWTSISRTLRLSSRELQILRIVIEDRGQSDAEIGQILSMSPHTVHTHFERLYRKTAVSSRTGLVLRIFAEYVALAADG